MKKYITTAIPYANAKPHIGHAMDYLLADVFVRYHRQRGDEVRFSAGLDEHATKIAKKAADKGMQPREFVDNLAPYFRNMINDMNIEITDFVRTTDVDHIGKVQKIWQTLDAADMIYKDTYEGWYCSGCEAFITETEAREVDYKCPMHRQDFEKLSEENYYLCVSKFTDQIRDFVSNSIVPEFRGKEMLELVKNGAQDVSISRPVEKLSWGIPVPGDESQVMYVWVDALSNYITALGYPENGDYKQWWPAAVQVVGKDILRFHAIIWPTILLGLGLELPQKILVHGFVNIDGQKMSKSIGNVISPSEIIEKYGTDAFRYYFIRHVPTFDDGDFTWEKFEAAYNGELANDLGNLVSRLATMIAKYDIERRDSGKNRHTEIVERYHDQIKKFELSRAIEAAWEVVQNANRYIDETKPWEIAKTDSERLSEVLNNLWNDMILISELLAPFLPETADKICEIFAGDKVGQSLILFPRIER